MYRTLNPTTEELISTYELHEDTAVEKVLEQSSSSFATWSSLSFSERGKVFSRAAELLDSGCERYARLMAEEMGKPLSQGEGEVAKCAAGCRYYAEQAEAYLAPQRRERVVGGHGTIHYDALGPIFAIMPWNYPFWQVFRFIAPTMMAGNTVVLKHAPNTPGCALAIEELMKEAGAPSGSFSTLFLDNEQSRGVIEDFRVRGVSLTGSSTAGRAVGAAAGGALKKVVLELGGSDPFVVLSDADLAQAAKFGARSRCANAGQVCCAAKRFIVEQSVFDEFSERFIDEMDSQVLGDPLEEGVTMGPLAREDIRERLREQVAKTVSAGAKVLSEQSPPRSTGYFFGPVVMTSVAADSPGLSEELFGPVAVLQVAADEAEAVDLANATEYGLGASVWSQDLDRAQRTAAKLQSGLVAINDAITSDVALPFGGTKNSGLGRELGEEGIREFVNPKVVWERS